jgi:hypothetical protein
MVPSTTNQVQIALSRKCNDTPAKGRMGDFLLSIMRMLVVAHALAFSGLVSRAFAQVEAAASAGAKIELTGLVQDEDGKPLEGVTVDVWHWFPGNETKTDASGRFTLKGFDPKEIVEVLFSKEGFSPKHFPKQSVAEADWVVELGNKTYFEGKIIGTDGKPVSEATISASFGPVELEGGVAGEVPTEGKGRNDGTYRLYVAPGTYDLKISAGPRGVFRETGVVIAQNEAKSIDIQLKKGARFEANIIDSISGEPVADFILWQWRGAKLFRRSSAEGKIVFEGLIPGEIEFNCGGGQGLDLPHGGKYYDHGPFGRWWCPEATHEHQRFHLEPQRDWQRNFDSLHFDMQPDMKPVTIFVEKGVTITGRVTDPKGNPVENATVAPALTGSGNSLTGDTRYSVKTAKDGSYKVVLPASNEATYNLMVHDGDYQEWRNWANGVSEKLKTEPGKKIENYDLKLTEPATIRGRILIGGEPAAGIEVRTHAFDKLENRYYDPTTKTKEDGTFELKFVRPGKHHLQASPFWLDAANAPNGSQIVELKPGEILKDVELTTVRQK